MDIEFICGGGAACLVESSAPEEADAGSEGWRRGHEEQGGGGGGGGGGQGVSLALCVSLFRPPPSPPFRSGSAEELQKRAFPLPLDETFAWGDRAYTHARTPWHTHAHNDLCLLKEGGREREEKKL